MHDEMRYEVLGRVFREMPREFAGRPLQPLTAGRWELLRARKNAFLFAGEERRAPRPILEDYPATDEWLEACREWDEAADAEDRAVMTALVEYLWVHTAPVREVLAAARDEEVWCGAVEAYALEHVCLEELTQFAGAFAETARAIEAAMVEALPEDDEEPGKRAPSPIGWPATCGGSADTGAPSGGNGCSGGSISPRGSNTSTPRRGTTGRAASGAPAVTPMPVPPARPAAPTGRSAQSGWSQQSPNDPDEYE